MMAKAIPVEPRHAKSGTRRNHSAIAFGVFTAFADRDEILGVERIDTVGVRFQIIEQADGIEFELLGQLAGINGPRKIGNLAASGTHRSCHSETGAVNRDALSSNELSENLHQATV